MSTSGSRTAVAEQSGAKSQVTGLVGAGLVAVLLLFLNSLLADLPQTALAAVVIVAALSLMDLGILRRYYRVRKSALALSLVATAGVIFFGVLQGIVVAVILAILLFFRRNWWPHGAVLGQVDGVPGWHGIDDLPRRRAAAGHRRVPLGGAALLRQRRHVPPADPAPRARRSSPSWVVLQCEAITDIDVTAAEMLEQLDKELNADGDPPGVRRAARPAAGPRAALRALRDPRPRPLLPDPHCGTRRCRGPRPTESPVIPPALPP